MEPIILRDEDLYHKYNTGTHYLRELVKDSDYILCMESAAELLGLFSGFISPNVFVYKKCDCDKNNVAYEERNGIVMTTMSQTVKDLLNNKNSDIQAVVETLDTLNYGNFDIDIDKNDLNEFGRDMLEMFG